MRTTDDKFCAAPFTSMYEGQFGKVSACCAMYDAIGNSNDNSLEEIFNSKEFNLIRKSFLENEFPPQCVTCKEFENKNNVVSNVRTAADRFAGNKLELALKNTRPDGSLKKQVPVFLDFLWSNNCNFACLGCNGELSSTIATKYSEAYALSHGNESYKLNQKLWENNNQTKIDYVLKHKDSIKKIHLNGGEPFMQKGIYEFLEKLLEHDLHKTIHIWSHTNGSITSYKNKDIIDDYLVHWGENCSVTVSHDGYGEQGEYVRFGLKQQKWLTNVNRLLDKNINVRIQTCYNLFNAPAIHDLHLWYNNNISISERNRSINSWYDPICYTAKFIQLDPDLHRIANDQLDQLEKYNNIGWDINYLRSTLNSKLSNEEITKGKNNFKKSIDKYDELRKTNFLKTFPKFENLYSLC